MRQLGRTAGCPASWVGFISGVSERVFPAGTGVGTSKMCKGDCPPQCGGHPPTEGLDKTKRGRKGGLPFACLQEADVAKGLMTTLGGGRLAAT